VALLSIDSTIYSVGWTPSAIEGGITALVKVIPTVHLEEVLYL
jgi:hypothetical protein